MSPVLLLSVFFPFLSLRRWSPYGRVRHSSALPSSHNLSIRCLLHFPLPSFNITDYLWTQLAGNLAHHLGSDQGFFSRWIPSVSAVYSLSDMNAESKSVVDGWISDLFGEGISDDLLQSELPSLLDCGKLPYFLRLFRSTKPHLLLRVAPTICKQFLAAFGAGVIDIDSLRDACAYFHQDLLSFTLPGVIHWLTGEIRRTQ